MKFKKAAVSAYRLAFYKQLTLTPTVSKHLSLKVYFSFLSDGACSKASNSKATPLPTSSPSAVPAH
jgi:hypothetical protein